MAKLVPMHHQNACQNLAVKRGLRCKTISAGRPWWRAWRQHTSRQHTTRIFVKSCASCTGVIVVQQASKWHIFVNQSHTTKMQSFPAPEGGRAVIRSIDTDAQGRSGI